MPKQTFFNLSTEKRERIIAVALQEFKEFDYSKASISRIVAKAGIAKGSFYQYFSGKKDLFSHIIDLASEKKLDYLKDVQIGSENRDFFELLREVYIAGLKFSRDYPELGEISDNLMKSKDEKFKEEILGTSMQKSDAFLTALLQRGAEQGELKGGLDFTFIAFLMTRVSIALGEYIRERGYSEKNLEKRVGDLIELLENGLRA